MAKVAPVIRQQVKEMVRNGEELEQIMAKYPDLKEKDVVSIGKQVTGNRNWGRVTDEIILSSEAVREAEAVREVEAVAPENAEEPTKTEPLSKDAAKKQKLAEDYDKAFKETEKAEREWQSVKKQVTKQDEARRAAREELAAAKAAYEQAKEAALEEKKTLDEVKKAIEAAQDESQLSDALKEYKKASENFKDSQGKFAKAAAKYKGAIKALADKTAAFANCVNAEKKLFNKMQKAKMNLDGARNAEKLEEYATTAKDRTKAARNLMKEEGMKPEGGKVKNAFAKIGETAKKAWNAVKGGSVGKVLENPAIRKGAGIGLAVVAIAGVAAAVTKCNNSSESLPSGTSSTNDEPSNPAVNEETPDAVSQVPAEEPSAAEPTPVAPVADDNTEVTEPTTTTPEDDNTEVTTDEGTATGGAASVDDEIERVDQETQSILDDDGVYEVKKGDNVWNIVKKVLEEKLGRTPTGTEIIEGIKKVMEENGMEWYKPEVYGETHIMIRPKDAVSCKSLLADDEDKPVKPVSEPKEQVEEVEEPVTEAEAEPEVEPEPEVEEDEAKRKEEEEK